MVTRSYGAKTWMFAAALALCGGAPAVASDSKSAPLAKELSALMASRRIEAFAVQDPARPGFYVAVRSYPGVQLLLVGAESNALEYMKYQLDRKDYGESYAALHNSAVPTTKLFVQDMGCDGLSQNADHVDVVYQQTATHLLVDDSGKASGLSKDAFKAKVAEVDARYAELLQLVLKTIRADTAATR
jgi:hypothetical protein